jgi:lipid A 3-O-deacylase
MMYSAKEKPGFLLNACVLLLFMLIAPLIAPLSAAAATDPPAATLRTASSDIPVGVGENTVAVSTNTAAASTDTTAGTGKVPAITSTASASTETAAAGTKEMTLPNQHGMSLEYGYTFDPHQDITFLLARVFAIYDYGTFWHQNHTKEMRFKVEGAIGSTLTPASNLMASANMLILYYYPGSLLNRSVRPYMEGGIGVIYTEFRVKRQGLHYNFNPILGLGLEFPQENGKNAFAAVRLHHLSNANLYHENRGVNSVELQIGRYF